MLPRRLMLLGFLASAVPAPGFGQIEGLDPPRAARPPAVDQDRETEETLEKKREERHEREQLSRPKPVPYKEKQEKALLKETLTPRERWLLLELSLVFCGADTTGKREGYTCEPTTHFNGIVRKGGKDKDGKVGLWYGGRLAPFGGTGYYKKKPGTYNLTYFGPMIGVGKIDPVPADGAGARAASADGETHIPNASGWLVTTGIAAVTRSGRTSDKTNTDNGNDFRSKGLTFDSPGIWLEARYLRVQFGALGFDVSAGVQTGREKFFVYGGFGVAAWD